MLNGGMAGDYSPLTLFVCVALSATFVYCAVRVVGRLLVRVYSSQRFRTLCLYWLSRQHRVHCTNPGAQRVLISGMDTGTFVDRGVKHTHGYCAAARNCAVDFARRVALMLGKTPYSVQKSSTDVKDGIEGSRTWYWARDANIAPSAFNPGENDVLYYSDVDMYMDMPTILAEVPNVHVICSFVPDTVSYSGKEYSYTFNEHDEVLYHVSGGAHYSHKVWNYGTDVVYATAQVGPWWFPFIHQSVVYWVDRRRVMDNHYIHVLIPSAAFRSWFVNVSRWVDGHQIKRLNVCQPAGGYQFLRLSIRGREDMYRSTGLANQFASATIKAVHDDTLSRMQVSYKHDLTAAQVTTVTGLTDDTAITTLVMYHRAKGGVCCDVVYSAEIAMKKYEFGPKTHDPEAKPCMTAFMPPFIEGAYVPVRSLNNDRQAVLGRITKVKASATQSSARFASYVREFLGFMVPFPGQGHPVSLEEVYDRQPRPNQQSILHSAEWRQFGSAKATAETFMKAEPYDGPKDPRIISQLPPATKMHYSRYTYAFDDHMRDLACYAFGKKPREIAARVVHVCSRARKHVSVTDFSRFDGRVSQALREVERGLLLRFFNQSYHSELLELLMKNTHCKAFTVFGESYETEWARLSGSGETAGMNSASNMFIAYVALRNTTSPDTGLYYTPEEAFEALGVYGGDDGLTADVPTDIYTQVAYELGQVLEAEVIERGKSGVNFLARYYGPRVWVGDSNSCCDIVRQLMKFHLTSGSVEHIGPERKAMEKATAYLLSDGCTPIIGAIARVIVAVVGKADEFTHDIAPYGASFDPDNQYENKIADWMEDLVDLQMPGFRRTALASWLTLTVDIPSLFKPHEVFWSAPIAAVKTDVVVNGKSVMAEMVDRLKSRDKSGEDNQQPATARRVVKLKKTEWGNAAKGVCTVPECGRVAVNAGRCDVHGRHRQCAFSGCESRAFRGAFCPTHYRERLEDGKVGPGEYKFEPKSTSLSGVAKVADNTTTTTTGATASQIPKDSGSSGSSASKTVGKKEKPTGKEATRPPKERDLQGEAMRRLNADRARPKRDHHRKNQGQRESEGGIGEGSGDATKRHWGGARATLSILLILLLIAVADCADMPRNGGRGRTRRARKGLNTTTAIGSGSGSQPQSRRQRTRKAMGRGASSRSTTTKAMAAETAAYAASLDEPFADMPNYPKVPDAISVRTISVKVKIYTTVSAGGLGNLAVALTPFYNVWESVITASPPITSVPTTAYHEMYPLLTSSDNANWSGTTMTAWDDYYGLGLSSPDWSVRPDDVESNVIAGARCVSAGLRVTFAGNYSNTNGLFFGALMPKELIRGFYYVDEGDVDGSGTTDQLPRDYFPRSASALQTTYGVKAIPAEEGIEVRWFPQDPESVMFTPLVFDAARRVTQIRAVDQIANVADTAPKPQLNAIPSMLIIGTGLSPTASYAVEAQAVFECTLAPGISTFLPSEPSPVDTVGFSEVLHAVQSVDNARPSPAGAKFSGGVAMAASLMRGLSMASNISRATGFLADTTSSTVRSIGSLVNLLRGRAPTGRKVRTRS